jgi:hypothetical protein
LIRFSLPTSVGTTVQNFHSNGTDRLRDRLYDNSINNTLVSSQRLQHDLI